MEYRDSETGNSKGFGSRLWWVIKAVFIVFLILIVIGGLVGGGYFGFLELQRSFTSVSTQIAANEQRIDLLRGDVSEMRGGNPGQQEQIDTLETAVSNLDEQVADVDDRVTDLQDTLAADLERQGDMLTMLETEVMSLTVQTDNNTADTDALSTALLDLQGDVTENVAQIDELGGEVDQLSADVTTLDSGVAGLREDALIGEEAEAVIDDVQQTLVIFRLWEFISRARLRLAENNVGLAEEDINLALDTIEMLQPLLPEAEAEIVGNVASRLSLAADNLPGNTVGASLDLENAWDELDALLALRIDLPALEETAVEETAVDQTTDDAPATPSPTATAPPPATPTPQPTAVPEATPTPTPQS